MSEVKYHTSKSGFLTRCTAEKRACPRGSQHYTQSEYEKLVSENDVRVRPTPSRETNKIAKDKNGYYYKAEQEYVEAMKGADNYNKAHALREKETAKLFRENGLKESEKKNYIAERDATILPMTSYARKIYVEEGVRDYTASVIMDKMHNSKNPSRVLTKRHDSRDPDILAKTKRAAERLKTDPEFAKLKKAYNTAESKLTTMEEINNTTFENFNKRIASNGGNKGNNWGTPNPQRVEAYKEAKAWLAAGVPAAAKGYNTTRVTPDVVSVDKSGKINNAWVQHKDGKVERIVSYTPGEHSSHSMPYNKPGALVTESGAEVNSHVHYTAVKSVSGTQRIILGPKNGDSYPAESFSLEGYSDSSG